MHKMYVHVQEFLPGCEEGRGKIRQERAGSAGGKNRFSYLWLTSRTRILRTLISSTAVELLTLFILLAQIGENILPSRVIARACRLIQS